MGRFFVGFVIGVILVVVAELLWVRLGFVNPRADIPVSHFEMSMAMPALDAAVDRRAPKLTNPVQPTDDNLIAGMKLYQTNCASCHGDTQQPDSMFAEALYPRAPQFMKDSPDMPENQNFYIIEHGVRLSGMPAWGKILSEQQAWQLTAFLSHMDKLPPDIAAQWKTLAEPNADQGHSERSTN